MRMPKILRGLIAIEKIQATKLLLYAKGMDTSKDVTKNLCLDDTDDWMHCDREVPVVCQMTEKEIVSIVMMPTQEESDV